jgi:phosphopantetheine adenylyltransferase
VVVVVEVVVVVVANNSKQEPKYGREERKGVCKHAGGWMQEKKE